MDLEKKDVDCIRLTTILGHFKNKIHVYEIIETFSAYRIYHDVFSKGL